MPRLLNCASRRTADRALVFPDSSFSVFIFLALYNLKNICRTCLCTDTAGDALGRVGSTGRHYHHVHRTCLHTFAAAYAGLLIDHICTLCVLLDGSVLTGSHRS